MAQIGNKNASKNRIWAEAINKILCQSDTGKKRKLELLAEKLIECALDGDMSAIKEIGDRVDGKAQAEITVAGSLDVTEYRGVSEVGERVAELISSRTDGDPESPVTH